jgi:hypothetical protein
MIQAMRVGALWHQQFGKDNAVDEDFNVVYELSTKHPKLREKIRCDWKADPNKFLKFFIMACHRLRIEAQNITLDQALMHYKIQVFEFDQRSRTFNFKSQKGNHRSLQTIQLFHSSRKHQGKEVEHYDPLLKK